MGTNINGNAGHQGYTDHRYSHKKPSDARIIRLLKKKKAKKNDKYFK